MIAVVLPAAIAAFTSAQVRSSMYTDCAPPECSGAAGVAATAATFKETAIAANRKTPFIMVPLLHSDSGDGQRRNQPQQRTAGLLMASAPIHRLRLLVRSRLLEIERMPSGVDG